ncbi:hypothetical protein D3C87_1522190 [compost metagenome]
MAKLRQIDQSLHCHQDDGCQHDGGQVCQEAREEDQAQRNRDGGEHECQWGLRAGLVIDRRLGESACDRVSLEQSRRQVRRTQGQ